MADREKLKAEVNPLTNTLVQNILRKHGVSKDNVRTLSEEEKENILKILEDLKAQSEAKEGLKYVKLCDKRDQHFG